MLKEMCSNTIKISSTTICVLVMLLALIHGNNSTPPSTQINTMSTPSTTITTSSVLGSYCNRALTKGKLRATQVKKHDNYG